MTLSWSKGVVLGMYVKISNIVSSDSISIEYWSRSDSKSLIGSVSSDDLGPVYLDYPENAELWIRVVHSDESDFSPYRFDLVRYDDETEGAYGGRNYIIPGIMGFP